jgi:DNA-methyltransferase (dcm)
MTAVKKGAEQEYINNPAKTGTDSNHFLSSQPLRMVELFAGIGVPRLALHGMGVKHTSVISEIDKHKIAAYMAIHGETENLGDVCELNKIPPCDILTAGFPCQSLSIAGKKEGMKKGSGTESSLGWEVIRALENSDILPNHVMIENSDQLVSKRNIRDADQFINAFAKLGYTISKKIVNAKNHGSPQNRSRIYIVASFDGSFFQFPPEVPLTSCLRDKLEKDVASDYYMTAEQIANYEAHKERHDAEGHGFGWKPIDLEDAALSLSREIQRGTRATSSGNLSLMEVGSLNNHTFESCDRVYSADGICPTVKTPTGGGLTIKIIDNTKKGYIEAEEGDTITLTQPTSKTRRARVQKQISSALTTDGKSIGVIDGYSIRYLTEREYWRIQELPDWAFDRAAEVSSRTQLYKQAGDAMNLKVVEAIFRTLLTAKQPKMPSILEYCEVVV